MYVSYVRVAGRETKHLLLTRAKFTYFKLLINCDDR